MTLPNIHCSLYNIVKLGRLKILIAYIGGTYMHFGSTNKLLKVYIFLIPTQITQTFPYRIIYLYSLQRVDNEKNLNGYSTLETKYNKNNLQSEIMPYLILDLTRVPNV